MLKLKIGDDNRGYDTAEVTLINKKLRLTGETYGDKTLLKRAIANYNRGINYVVTNYCQGNLYFFVEE